MTSITATNWHLIGKDVLQQLAASAEPFVTGMERGSMRLVMFAPRGVDTQEPHAQDEIYIIADGSAAFLRNGERIRCKAGDALFVPGSRHAMLLHVKYALHSTEH